MPYEPSVAFGVGVDSNTGATKVQAFQNQDATVTHEKTVRLD
jgi:hypothetical protein